MAVGWQSALLVLAGYLAGTVAVPVLLPWLPGRSFAAKGTWVGVAVAVVVAVYGWVTPSAFQSRAALWAWALILPAVTSFLGMSFTGASTYTSLSGVRREMRVAVPIQIACAVAGLGLWMVGRFV